MNIETITDFVESCKKDCSCDLEVRYNEPMAEHTSFKTGGPADCWLRPSGDGFPAFAAVLLKAAQAEHIPVFILGAGANILVADAGIRGIVLDTSGWTGRADQGHNGMVEFRAGTSLDAAAEIAAGLGLSGLEFLAGMPGSIGGGIWMNARCYGFEIADVLQETELIDYSQASSERLRIPANRADFAYKHSPFQGHRQLILCASFLLQAADEQQIRAAMDTNRKDRVDKGHYRYPSAGSVFKNNPAFDKPSGKIIDELGLRGLQTGRAQVAPWHGNIIINHGGASAADIRSLVDEVSAKVKSTKGFELEPEILFVGQW